jgi:cobyrinic acid a,c-diamide synthase
VLGCQSIRPGVELAGVMLNRVGSDAHLTATAEAIRNATGLAVLGSLPDEASIAVPERHLGLVPANESGVSRDILDRLAALALERFDLDAILRIANAAPDVAPDPVSDLEPVAADVRVAVAQDRAFGFYYQDTMDLLAECGAELVPFSPLDDASLPVHVDGLYIGGGFPELHAPALSANASMRASIHRHAAAARPIYAECGGLMALGHSLSTFDGQTLPMFGLLPVASRMQREALTIGYREVTAVRDLPLMPRGASVRGHEFHWSIADAPPPALAAYRLSGPVERLEGFCLGSTLASYVHLNLAGAPHLARRFVEHCTASRA